MATVLGTTYVGDHYKCAYCETPLTGKRYVLRQDQPTCLTCFEENFAAKCFECGQAIGTDFKDLSYKGRHWHEECFKCWTCQGSLADEKFVSKENGIYCGACYEKNFALRCDKCDQTFKHAQQKYEYFGKRYHASCFTCAICQLPIGNNNFVPREEDTLICMSCYNDNFAKRCGKCADVLLLGGVTFREEAYHKECFICTKCKVELAHTKFTTKDDQPYCSECYVRNFAKVCIKCDQAIAGLGTPVKYVAFDGKQWHADCFMCTVCDKSLLGQGFLKVDDNVVCPDCAKNM